MTEFEIKRRQLAAAINRRLEPLMAQARARYQKLESRERLLVKLASAAVAIFLAYNLVYLPIVDWQSGLQDKLSARRHELADVHSLVNTYLQRAAELKDAEKNTVSKNRDFSLFSVVESSLSNSVGHDKISSITPAADHKLSDGFTQYTVELKLQDMDLSQIVDALYGIKALPSAVAVSNLRIQRRLQDPHSYDLDMTCIALGKNG